MNGIQELKYKHKRVMKVGGNRRNLFYPGSYQDLIAGVTKSAQTFTKFVLHRYFPIYMHVTQSYRDNTNLSMFK